MQPGYPPSGQDPYGQQQPYQDPYGQPQYGQQPPYSQPQYGQPGYGQYPDPNQQPQQQPYQDPYAQPQQQQPYQDPYAQPQQQQPYQDPYAQPQQVSGNPYPTSGNPYPTSGNPYPTSPSYPGYPATPGYGQAGYGAPQSSNNVLAIVGMILGILSIPLACCLYIGVLPGAAGIVLGVLGQKKAAELGGAGKGMALAGIITGACGVGFALILLALQIAGNAVSWTY
jgi:hypothetical protein